MPATPPDKTMRQQFVEFMIGCLLVAAVPLLVLLGLGYLLYSIVLRSTMWAVYCTRGVNVLFVYSDSPVWKDYLEAHIIPELPETALMLNWSQRSRWHRSTLPVRIFGHFGGSKNHCPLAIVFRPFRCTKVFRFWQPFRDWKHGKTDALESLQSELMRELDSLKPRNGSSK